MSALLIIKCDWSGLLQAVLHALVSSNVPDKYMRLIRVISRELQFGGR